MIYGELKSEQLTAESDVARNIVREINHFEVNDRQRFMIIYSLALELEDIEEMKKLTSFMKESFGHKMFITKIFGVEEESNGEI
jgi:hypothetical protein